MELSSFSKSFLTAVECCYGVNVEGVSSGFFNFHWVRKGPILLWGSVSRGVVCFLLQSSWQGTYRVTRQTRCWTSLAPLVQFKSLLRDLCAWKYFTRYSCSTAFKHILWLLLVKVLPPSVCLAFGKHTFYEHDTSRNMWLMRALGRREGDKIQYQSTRKGSTHTTTTTTSFSKRFSYFRHADLQLKLLQSWDPSTHLRQDCATTSVLEFRVPNWSSSVAK